MKKLDLALILFPLLLAGAGCASTQPGAKTDASKEPVPAPAMKLVVPTVPPAVLAPDKAPLKQVTGWTTYFGFVYRYAINHPPTSVVRTIDLARAGDKNVLEQIEIDNPAATPKTPPETIVRVTVWANDTAMRNAAKNYASLGIKGVTQKKGGDSLVVYAGKAPNDTQGTRPLVDAFMAKNGHVYELDILAETSDLNDPAISAYLSSFQVR